MDLWNSKGSIGSKELILFNYLTNQPICYLTKNKIAGLPKRNLMTLLDNCAQKRFVFIAQKILFWR